jgi:hypothetical protein
LRRRRRPLDLTGGGARRHRPAGARRNAEAQDERADLDRLTERQRLPGGGDALALDEGAVRRQVAHHEAARGDLDRRMLARHVVVLEHHGRVGAAPDGDERPRQRRDRARSFRRGDFHVDCWHG